MTARSENVEDARGLESNRTSLALWFGLLGGPAAGLGNILVNYPAVAPSCSHHSSLGLHASTMLFFLVAIGAGGTSLSLRRRWEDTRDTRITERRRFMATVGVLTAAVSVFAIILQWIPVFVLGACYSS
jgi:hypothetical protein